jgi:hypothetical protein
LTLYSRQWRPKAKMGCPPEREMAIVLTRNIEPIWVGEAFWVAVASCHNGNDGLSFADLLSSELCVFRSQSCRVLAGAFVA